MMMIKVIILLIIIIGTNAFDEFATFAQESHTDDEIVEKAQSLSLRQDKVGSVLFLRFVLYSLKYFLTNPS